MTYNIHLNAFFSHELDEKSGTGILIKNKGQRAPDRTCKSHTDAF